MNHTKEPWIVTNSGHGGIGVIEGDSGIFVAEVDGRTAQEIMSNTSRIVACVNACADVDDDRLSLGYVKGLEAENAKMKEVLSMIASQKLENEVDAEEWEDADFECAYDSIVRNARSALR